MGPPVQYHQVWSHDCPPGRAYPHSFVSLELYQRTTDVSHNCPQVTSLWALRQPHRADAACHGSERVTRTPDTIICHLQHSYQHGCCRRSLAGRPVALQPDYIPFSAAPRARARRRAGQQPVTAPLAFPWPGQADAHR